MSAGPGKPGPVVWDAPTRLGHWVLAALVAFAWWSAEYDHQDWHLLAGCGVLFILVFRLYWGLVGSETARFAHFLRGPRAIWAYARTLGTRRKDHAAGHNPLGALSVVALLLTLAVQTITGLFAVDIDGIASGPLSDRVDFDTGRRFADWHHQSFTVLEVLVALHLAAIAFYRVYKRADLVGPMITGRDAQAESAPPPAPLWRALPGIVLAGALAWWVMHGLKL